MYFDTMTLRHFDTAMCSAQENAEWICPKFFLKKITKTDKYGQIRTNTDGHYFFMIIFAPSISNWPLAIDSHDL